MRADLDTRGATEVTVDGMAERGLSREAYSLLAQANLLRMRGLWADAIEKCMSALRLSPDNPSAQSLLGDIYENQGRLDDAIQWYRMALDVQPDSPADRIKLAQLLDRKAQTVQVKTLVSQVEPAKNETAPRLPVIPPKWLDRWRSDPDLLLKRSAFVAGSLSILVVLVALFLAHQATSYLESGKEVNVPTVLVTNVPPAKDPVTGPADGSTPFGDPADVSLLSALQATPGLAEQGIFFEALQTDPRSGKLTMTIECQPSSDAGVSRDLILRDAAYALQAAAKQALPDVISQFTVRCLLLSSSGGSTPLVFTADATRAQVAAFNPDLKLMTTDQLASAFAEPWWAQTVPPT